MNIGIDFDGVILDTERHLKFFADYYSYFKLGQKRKKSNVVEPELCFDWTEENKKYFYEKYYRKATKIAPFMPGVKEVLTKLKKEGHKLYIITAREYNSYFDETIDAKKRLKELDVEFDGIFCEIKNKAEKCEELGIDLMIEDNPKNIIPFIGKETKVLYFKDVYIKNVFAPNIKKIDTWMDIYLEANKK
jgi:uncharacterized HAD superfamily protein